MNESAGAGKRKATRLGETEKGAKSGKNKDICLIWEWNFTIGFSMIKKRGKATSERGS